jgi:outer membrane immunogenic protein
VIFSCNFWGVFTVAAVQLSIGNAMVATNRWGTILKTFKYALVGSAFLFGAVSAASAADVYQRGGGLKDESYAYAPITWTGFYVGANVGATFGDELDVDTELTGNFSFDIDNALMAGIHIGYNWQTPSNWVYGIEADLGVINDENEDLNIDVTDYLATIRGRLGYAFGNSLIYGTAGVAFLGYSEDVQDFGSDDTAVGFVAGAGVEHKLSSNFSLGVEGLYYNFSSDGNNLENGDFDIDRDFWAIRARATYHFNADRYDAPLK